MNGVPEGEEEREGSVSFRPIALGAAIGVLLHVVVGATSATSGEPALLRWLRVLADHPVRASIAVALVFAAIARSSSGPSRVP